ncbi:MAG TPA: HAMP domain-containing sensor histidine kinase, partial [Pirellulaceae bacterium]|nr:HAMP domain-containing sensor histidine kinase [Pirellulaceae bacterium]
LALSNTSNRELTQSADAIVQFNAAELSERVDQLTRQVRFTADTMCTVVVAVLLLVMVWKWRFQRTILQRVDRLRETMQHFAEGDMSQRASEDGEDELGLIAAQFNRMARNLGSQHRQLLEVLEAADAASRVKNEFLSNISHELRTPLHGIVSFARFGLEESATADREVLADYYRTIGQCGAALLTHVNDLLDLAKLEAGRMKMNFSPHSLVELIGLVSDEYHSFCSEHRLNVVFDAPLDGVEVCLDGARIQQVLRQLLGNAAKFSPEGGEIRVSLLSDEEAVCVSIADHGPGVPPDELELIFDKFSQSSATNTGSGGTGLGLAICRQIINAHRGRIWAMNSPQGGACFSFEIPRRLEAAIEDHESRLQVTH